jgi:hypothetical protein
MKRLSKSLLIGAAALGVLTGAFAQSKFWTGIGTTNDWNSAIWGDGNGGTTELILAPGSDFYLFFKVQFQPGYGNSSDWAIINLFLDLTRQSASSPVGANYTSAISGYANSAEWAQNPSKQPCLVRWWIHSADQARCPGNPCQQREPEQHLVCLCDLSGRCL